MKLLSKYLLLLLLISACGQLHAQIYGRGNIDSMLTELSQQKEDTNKVKLLTRLSFEFDQIKPDEGIKYGEQALVLATKLDWKQGMGISNNDIGIGYECKFDYTTALEYYLKALRTDEKVGYDLGQGKALNNIAGIYLKNDDITNALEYYFKALKVAEKIGDKKSIAIVLGNLGAIYGDEKGKPDYDKAMEYTSKTLDIYKELGDKKAQSNFTSGIGDIYRYKGDTAKALEYYFAALKITDEDGYPYPVWGIYVGIGSVYLAEYKNDPKPSKLNFAIEYLEKGLSVSKTGEKLDGMQKAYGFLSDAYKMKGDYKQAMENADLSNAVSDSIFSIKSKEKLTRFLLKSEYDKRAVEAEKNAALKLQKQKVLTYSGIAGILLLGAFSFFILKERRKSENLLLNILPNEVAKELKSKGSTTARHFENVTVLFTDFVNFTGAGERMAPQALIDELHNCFRAFDEITAKYGIEKIKTIGDAYLAVAGLPTADPRHAEHVVRASTEIIAFIEDRIAKLGIEQTFDIRIGIHSGSVVAGIVGVKKFAYDIWGDAVNTAARMEQHSESGKINISETTYQLVKEKFNCIYRGEIDAKGKGKLRMYYVA